MLLTDYCSTHIEWQVTDNQQICSQIFNIMLSGKMNFTSKPEENNKHSMLFKYSRLSL